MWLLETVERILIFFSLGINGLKGIFATLIAFGKGKISIWVSNEVFVVEGEPDLMIYFFFSFRTMRVRCVLYFNV